MKHEVQNTAFLMRDGCRLHYRHYSMATAQSVMLLLPGFGLTSEDYVSCCQHLAKSSAVTVYSPDLRGQGQSQGVEGDVAYIGQLQDDLSDMIAALQQNHPGLPVVLAAHSGSSSLAISHLATRPDPGVVALYLLAPVFFGHMEYDREIQRAYPFIYYGRYHRKPAAHPASQLSVNQEFRYSLLRHGLGKMFSGLQNIRVLQVRRDAGQPWRNYSFRFLQSYRCRDLTQSLELIRVPVWLMAGQEDEVMLPDAVFTLLNWHLAPGLLRESRCLARMGHFSILAMAATLMGHWLRATVTQQAGTQ
ncbi:alpha/beta fold hydrolase [Pantoea sp. 9140]|uniref:alpha/beta fold hydrolase n=1 Tax=Pantoea sp. 9140 TaxID=1500896 RepID=UPI0007CC80A7|nr:alpha/beta fold hydrolase [Pantoea sp. 9140]